MRLMPKWLQSVRERIARLLMKWSWKIGGQGPFDRNVETFRTIQKAALEEIRAANGTLFASRRYKELLEAVEAEQMRVTGRPVPTLEERYGVERLSGKKRTVRKKPQERRVRK